MKYRITYETTATITAHVEVSDDVDEMDIEDYVSEQAHPVVERHLQTLGGSYGDINVSVFASIDGDGGGDVEPDES